LLNGASKIQNVGLQRKQKTSTMETKSLKKKIKDYKEMERLSMLMY
jgi:hypothetical protein